MSASMMMASTSIKSGLKIFSVHSSSSVIMKGGDEKTFTITNGCSVVRLSVLVILKKLKK